MILKKNAAEPQDEQKPEIETPSVSDDPATDRQAELRATVDRLQRLQAEFENYRKRIAKEAPLVEERATDRAILEILPLYDSLERAFRALASDEDKDTFVNGVEKIFAQFHQFLESKGVSRIECVGESFDPALHEAMLSIPSNAEKNTIVEEFMPGYTRGGRILQASKVSVSQGPASQEEEE